MRLRTIGLVITLALGVLSLPLAADSQQPGTDLEEFVETHRPHGDLT